MISILAESLDIGMKVNGLFKVQSVAKVDNGDVYYRTLFGIKRIPKRAIVKVTFK